MGRDSIDKFVVCKKTQKKNGTNDFVGYFADGETSSNENGWLTIQLKMHMPLCFGNN